MHEVDTIIAGLPLLANDFFRHLHRSRSLRVFLCGSRPTDRRFDLRMQVRRVLETRMGCSAFLGEDISDLQTPPRPDRNHLTIEVQEAARSDLIIMFFGSPGTIAEVTAFAMNRQTNPKLIVFNKSDYRDARSFVRLGPLRLLDDDRVIYYDAVRMRPSAELLLQLDRAVARVWFERSRAATAFGGELPLNAFLLMASLYATYPIGYEELSRTLFLEERSLRQALRELFQGRMIVEQEGKYVPTRPLEDVCIRPGLARDVARSRMAVMSRRLTSDAAVADYRLTL